MLGHLRNYSPTALSLIAGIVVVIVSFASGLIPVLGIFLNYFNALPLFLISLAFGLQFGVRAATIAVLGFTLFGGAYHAIGFLLMTYVPFLLLSYFLLRENSTKTDFAYPLAAVLSNVNLCLLLGLVALLLGASLYGIDVRHSIEYFLEKAIPSSLLISQPTAIGQLVDLFPSVLTISWISMSFINAWTAYQLLARQNLLRRVINFERDVCLDAYWDIIVTTGLMLIIVNHYFPSSLLAIIGKTIMLMGCLPLAALGFRICYLIVSRNESKRFLFASITILSFLLVWPLLIIVLLGFVEPWYGLMQRFADKNLPHNE